MCNQTLPSFSVYNCSLKWILSIARPASVMTCFTKAFSRTTCLCFIPGVVEYVKIIST